MLYVTTYLLILTEQGPFFAPRNPSCYVHFIFPPPDHSLTPPSHQAGQRCRSPASPRYPAAGCRTDRPTDTSSQGDGTTCATQARPRACPCCPWELKGARWAYQLPASGTEIPPTCPALSHEWRQPKGIPLLPHSLMLREHVSPTPSLPPAPVGFATASQGEGLGVTGEERAAAGPRCSVMDSRERLRPRPSALPPCQGSRESAKQSVFAASQAAGGPHKHRAPKSKEPGLPGGFAWKTRVVLFVSERGCTSLLCSRACARDFEMARARWRIWEVVMDTPGQ